MAEPLRILHILDHSIPLHSGYTFRTRAILNEQRALGWQTFHITSPKQGAVDSLFEEIDGLSFYRTPKIPKNSFSVIGSDQFATVSALKKRLRDVVAEVKPDLLHAHSPSLNGLAALSIAREFNLPLVYEVRAFWEDAAVDHGTSREWGPRYRLTRASETYLLKRADAVTTICQGLRNEMIDRGINADKITVIPNAVDIEKFSFQNQPNPQLKAELGLEDKTVLGFLGSFYAYEGLSLLISALPSMLSDNDNIRVLLVGGGPQEDNLKQQVADLKLQDQVIFTGRVPHSEVQKYYDLVDVLVYPRLPMRLTELVTPLKPLEAMAQGKIVIASDVGGHKELINDQENGFLFKSGDGYSLAETVLAVLANKDQWQRVAERGRHYVENERNWRVSVANYQRVYSALTPALTLAE
jgi:PEP-CTERM/exosortase A-associated glycosyltransferase